MSFLLLSIFLRTVFLVKKRCIDSENAHFKIISDVGAFVTRALAQFIIKTLVKPRPKGSQLFLFSLKQKHKRILGQAVTLGQLHKKFALLTNLKTTICLATLIVLSSYSGKSFALVESSSSSSGSCLEIYSGQKIMGYVLGLRSFTNNIHSTTSFTLVTPKKISGKQADEDSPFAQIVKSESDQYYNPLKSSFEIYSANRLIESSTASFQAKNDVIVISRNDKGAKSKSTTESDKGLVLYQHFTDLLFFKKKITEINPKEELLFQIFSETEGKVQQLSTKFKGQSDHLTLIHSVGGNRFETVHSSEGALISSHDLTKNLKIRSCTSNSVLTHLNSALSYNSFKSLFSFKDKEKIKKCCQHF